MSVIAHLLMGLCTDQGGKPTAILGIGSVRRAGGTGFMATITRRYSLSVDSRAATLSPAGAAMVMACAGGGEITLRGPVEPPRWPESHSDGGGPLLSSATPALIIRLAPFCEPSQAFDFLAIQNLASLWVLNLRTCTYWPLGCLASTYHSPPTLTGSAIIDHGWGTRLSPLLPSFFGPRIRGIMSGRQSLRHRPTPPASENLHKRRHSD
jgi:hypothetical protein